MLHNAPPLGTTTIVKYMSYRPVTTVFQSTAYAMVARVSMQSGMDEGMGRTREVVWVDNLDALKLPPGVDVLLARFPNIWFAYRLWLLWWLLLGVLCKCAKA